MLFAHTFFLPFLPTLSYPSTFATIFSLECCSLHGYSGLDFVLCLAILFVCLDAYVWPPRLDLELDSRFFIAVSRLLGLVSQSVSSSL